MILKHVKMPIGFSIAPRLDGYEPCLVLSDLSTSFYDFSPLPMSRADAIREGRSIARAYKMPFRSRISAFKSLIQEVSSDA